MEKSPKLGEKNTKIHGKVAQAVQMQVFCLDSGRSDKLWFKDL